jgi:5'-nucleotidase
MVRGATKISAWAWQATLAVLLALVATACADPESPVDAQDRSVTLTILGTNDVHGALSAQPGRGGLATFSGYVAAVRSAREADGGGVLLIDGGDMWQGTLESNLTEGASVVAAYNALEYTAATIGNHEFDFGPVGAATIPQSESDDPRGALKLRATEANFPLLAANLIDTSTNEPVNWENVQPSVMVDVAGVKIGIIGLMTRDALTATIAANVHGLRVAPLTDTIVKEARDLRARGATLIIVTAHAGGMCQQFADPLDLSSCDQTAEIMQVANALPPNLIDHIIAGHHHQRIAHIVNGISITSNYSNARLFGRVDFTIDLNSLTVSHREVFPPQPVCEFTHEFSGECATAESDLTTTVVARYEGGAIFPMSDIAAIADRAAARIEAKKAEKIGVYLETAITLEDLPESALGHLMTDAMLQSNDADISIHNVSGGIRANLPQGDLTYGSVFKMFPFDNQVVILDLSGAELRRVISNQVPNARRRAGLSGMQVSVDCSDNNM